MNRSKLAFASIVVAAIGIAWWLWSSSERAPSVVAPGSATIAHESRVAAETPRSDERVDASRTASREIPSTAPAIIAAPRSSHDLAVTGHVYVQGSRTPIDGAEIALCDSDGADFASTESDEHGAYEIPLAGGAPLRFGLRAKHPNFASTWLDSIPGDAGDVEFDVELDSQFVIGVDVWGPDGRGPVAGAELQLWSPEHAFGGDSLAGLSDAHGHFEFDGGGLPRSGLELVVEARGCAPWILRRLALETGARRRDVVCNLERPKKLDGRVVDARTKQPVAGAMVEIVGRGEEYRCGGGASVTDAFGAFEVELEDCPSDLATLYVQADGFRAARSEPLEMYTHGNGAELVIELSRPVHLRGTVRASDGSPITRAGLQATNSGFATRTDWCSAGAGGSFDLLLRAVAPAEIHLLCEAEGCIAKTLELTAVDDTRPLDITVERALRVRGRVTRKADARPLPGVLVRVLDRSDAIDSEVTGSDGEFRFQIERGTDARLIVELSGQRLAVADLGPVPDGASEVVRDISVEFTALARKR